MRCQVLRGLSLVLFVVLLFVFPLLLSAEEMAVISRAELETLLNEREFLKNELKDYKEKFEQIDQKFQALDLKYQASENELHRLKIESEIRIASLRDLKKTTTWNNIKWFLAGLGIGFAGGEAVGIKIGITL